MVQALQESGPPGLVVLVATALAAAWMLVLALAPLARLRPPSLLHMAGPGAVVAVGGAGTLWSQALVVDALGTASPEIAPRMAAAGYAMAAHPAWMGLIGASLVALLGALACAVTNVARAEEPRWTPVHALLALPAVGAVVPALLAGPLCALVTLVGTGAMGVASLRLGEKDDLRRMAAGRGLVGSLAVLAALFAGSASVLGSWITRAEALGMASEDVRDALAAEAVAGSTWALGGTVGASAALAIGATLTMSPVLKGLVDGRSSVNLLLAAFTAVLPVALVLPGLPALLNVQVPPASSFRMSFWEKQGIELVEVDGPQDPWRPDGSEVTIGTYWLYLDDARLAPYRAGRLDSDALGPDGRITDLVGLARINVETDRRTDLKRLLPVLRTLGQDGASEEGVCFVVRAPGGVPTCVRVAFDDPSEAPIHVLLESEVTLLIRGETLEPVDRGQLADALREASGRAAVHVRPEISAQRWVDAVVALHDSTGAWPIVVLD